MTTAAEIRARSERGWLYRNFPNVITTTRIVVPIPAWLTYSSWHHDHKGWATFWLLVTGIVTATDFVDGRLARWMGVVSDYGKIVDPVLDKLVLLSVFAPLLAAMATNDVSRWIWLFTGATLGTRLYQEISLFLWAKKSLAAGHIDGSNWNGRVKFCFDCLAATLGWILVVWVSNAWWPPLALDLALLGAIFYGIKSLSEYQASLQN